MPETISLTLRLPGLLHIALVKRAKAENRSLNAQIVHELAKDQGEPS